MTEFGPQLLEPTPEVPKIENATPFNKELLQMIDQLTDPENEESNFSELPPELAAMLQEDLTNIENIPSIPVQPVDQAKQLAEVTRTIQAMNKVQSGLGDVSNQELEIPINKQESGLSKFMKAISSFFKRFFSRR